MIILLNMINELSTDRLSPMELQELEKAEATATSEKSDPDLDQDQFRYEEKVVYSCLSIIIQLILFVVYHFFFGRRNIYQEVVLNGVCESAIIKACPRGNDFRTGMPTSTLAA